jgi:hypothetical protein
LAVRANTVGAIGERAVFSAQHLAKCRHLGGAVLLRLAGRFRQKAPKFLLQTAPLVRRSILDTSSTACRRKSFIPDRLQF